MEESKLTVVRYRSGHKNEWNLFLATAKNQTFLFNRNFMDYHSDRFSDHSVMVYEGDNLIACLPANETSGRIISHSGLTYGGLIVKYDVKLPVILAVFKSVLDYYRTQGFPELLYKSIPRIYNALPADEIDYALFLINAQLYRRDTAMVIPCNSSIGYSGNIRREAKKAADSGFHIHEDDAAWASFWNDVLEPNLQAKYKSRPVHSLEEILLLKEEFPANIRLFVMRERNASEVVAGTVLFVTPQVVHCQYISSTEHGRKSGALNFLFIKLLDEYFKDVPYFDLGIVNENDGRSVNAGLLAWKERLGGRSISHDFYKIATEFGSNLKIVGQ